MNITELKAEQAILTHVQEALRIAMKARLNEETAERWHERICFLTDSFTRHLQRMFNIKENDAYMELILDCPCTATAERAKQLTIEHRRLLVELNELLSEMRLASPRNLANLHSIRQSLHGFLVRLQKHHRNECELWLDSYLVDIGGEG
jgi:hypothetical protein